MASTLDIPQQYASNKGAKIHFSSDDGNVSFDAFIDSLSIDFSIDKDKVEDDSTDTVYTKDRGTNIIYSVDLKIPCASLEDAKEAASKIWLLREMFAPYSFRRGELVASGVKVLFSNLINNGMLFSGTGDDVNYSGVRTIVDNYNIDHNAEMGFFDGDKKFYPKVYSMSLSLKAIPSFVDKSSVLHQPKNLCLGFRDGNWLSYSDKDVRAWPFNIHVFSGDSGSKFDQKVKLGAQRVEHIPGTTDYGWSWEKIPHQAGVSEDGIIMIRDPYLLGSGEGSRRQANLSEREYSNNHDAIVLFTDIDGRGDSTNTVEFISFLSNFSQFDTFKYAEQKLGSDKVYSPESVSDSGFQFTLNVLANNLQQAIINLAKIQILLRLFAPKQFSTPPGKRCRVTLNRLIQKEWLYLNSLAIKIDTPMGMFESDGKLFPKVISLDFKLSRQYVPGKALDGSHNIITPDNVKTLGTPSMTPRRGGKIKAGRG